MLKEECLKIIYELNRPGRAVSEEEQSLLSAARGYVYKSIWAMSELKEMKEFLTFQVEGASKTVDDPEHLSTLYFYGGITSIRVLAHGVDIGVFYLDLILYDVYDVYIEKHANS